MFKRRNIKSIQIKISICRDVLEAIFDECDRNNIDETGGRIIGYYRQHENKLNITACGLIGPGPNARRSPTSFFQDGGYQETVFRKIEAEHPKIEHLGNWHTHHVNGLNTLSTGDTDTYTRIVNHEKHNTDFFYALLVVAKSQAFYNLERYLVKHFLLKRGESLVYEIPNSKVNITKEPAIYLDKVKAITEILKREPVSPDLISAQPNINHIRARDKEFISEMHLGLKPFFSKQTEGIYWRGKLNLIDNTSVDLIVLESVNEGRPSYSITLASSSARLFQCNRLYLKRSFGSAWKAIYSLERDLNREIFEKIKK